jgi:sugar phosphate isomerase/epimerase
MGVLGLIDLASARGLSGVEFPPLDWLGASDTARLQTVRSRAAEMGLYIVLDGGTANVKEMMKLIRTATLVGATTVRVTATDILCGDRRRLGHRWGRYLAEIADRRGRVAPLAQEAGVAIAVENHQDLTAAELVKLCADVGSDSVGVTLDAANPLAVVEDPLTFARRLGRLVKHVRLKDYRIFKTESGYRLVRCAIGSGVLDVPALLSVVSERAPAATIAIELGALEARHVRFLEDDFWRGYPPRSATDMLSVLRLRESHAQPEGQEWRTPWELSADHRTPVGYEVEQFEESLAYLRRLQSPRE